MNVIGVSCTSFSKDDFEHVLSEVSANFQHWEVFSELEHYFPRVVSTFSDSMQASELGFSLHTGIADINVASTNEHVREASVENVVSEMRAANVVGIDTVTIHPGLINMAVKGTRNRSLEQARRSMKVLEKAAGEFGVYACIENMPNLPIMLGAEASELAYIVDGTDLSICFDIGHANTAGQIESMIGEFGDRIRNVHIHDNMGERDEHLTLMDGAIDFKHVLGLLKFYKHRYIIESKTLASAIISRERLEELLRQ